MALVFVGALGAIGAGCGPDGGIDGQGTGGSQAGATGGAGGASGTGGSGGVSLLGSGGMAGSPSDAGADSGAADTATADAGGTGGAGAVSDGGPGEVGAGRACLGLPAGMQPAYMPVFRIPLRVHRTRSDLGDDQMCAILEEVNEIWWKQAGICFEIQAVKAQTPAATGLDFYFERSAPFPNGVNANGVYGGPHMIYGLDRPSLSTVPNPTRNAAARTTAHELGHALNLQHQNPNQEMNCLTQGTECDDLLMRSGHRGYKVTAGAPANVNEQIRARTRAQALALPPSAATVCAAPRILP